MAICHKLHRLYIPRLEIFSLGWRTMSRECIVRASMKVAQITTDIYVVQGEAIFLHLRALNQLGRLQHCDRVHYTRFFGMSDDLKMRYLSLVCNLASVLCYYISSSNRTLLCESR